MVKSDSLLGMQELTPARKIKSERGERQVCLLGSVLFGLTSTVQGALRVVQQQHLPDDGASPPLRS